MIDCDCSVNTDDCGQNRCQTEVIRKARKPHTCCECNETIHPGQRYEDASGIDHGGYAWRFRTCLPCSRIRQHYCPNGWVYRELATQIFDCIGFDYRCEPSEIPDEETK